MMLPAAGCLHIGLAGLGGLALGLAAGTLPALLALKWGLTPPKG